MFFETLGKLSTYVYKSPNTSRMAVSHLIDLTTTAVNIAAPALAVSYLSDYVSGKSDDTDSLGEESLAALYIAVGFGALSVTAQLFPKAKRYLLDNVRANVQSELTLAMVEKAYEDELNTHLTARTGDFAQALSKNYSSIDKLIPAFWGDILPIIPDTLGITGFLIAKTGPIGLSPLAEVILSMGVSLLLERSSLKVREECVKESYVGYGAVLKAINNYEVAHQFGNTDYEIEKVAEALARTEEKYRAMHYQDDRNSLISTTVNITSSFAILAALIFLVKDDDFSDYDILLFGYFLFYLNSKLAILPESVASFFTAVTDAERVVRFLSKPTEIKDSEDSIDLVADEPLRIEFRNVSFTHKGADRPTIDNLSFIIAAGESLAIVGPTGSGKSTIIRLLLRFYEPQSGEIYINHQSIKSYTLSSLRSAFGICAQSNTVFEGTVADNITYGDLNAQPRDIALAATYAEFVDSDPKQLAISDANLELENVADGKLVRNVGRDGGSLSGGEKQRVSIARMLLKGGMACILDEPTSALDPKTEAQIQATLENCTRNITTVLVTHRYTTVANASNIIYLDQGKIAEQGTFTQLMQQQGEFFNQLSVQCKELGLDPNSIVSNIQEKSEQYQDDSVRNNLQKFWQRRQLPGSSNHFSSSRFIAEQRGYGSTGRSSNDYGLPANDTQETESSALLSSSSSGHSIN